MKRITILVLFLSTLWGYSQVKSYTFSSSPGTYTPISGGTSLGDEATDNQYFVDPAIAAGGTATTGPGIPIGFSFMYNGNSYDRFAVNANGWISLGTTALGVN